MHKAFLSMKKLRAGEPTRSSTSRLGFDQEKLEDISTSSGHWFTSTHLGKASLDDKHLIGVAELMIGVAELMIRAFKRVYISLCGRIEQKMGNKRKM